MDERLKIEINEIINCKDSFGLPVFNELNKGLLREIYLTDENISYEKVAFKHGFDVGYILELTRSFEYVKAELDAIRKEESEVSRV